MEGDEENPMEIVQRLLSDPLDLLQVHVDYILKDVDSRSILTQEVFVKFSETPDLKDKVTTLLQVVLQEGESACQQLLDSFKKLQCEFPELCETFTNVRKTPFLEDVGTLKDDSALPEDMESTGEDETTDPSKMWKLWNRQIEDQSNADHLEDVGVLKEDASSTLPQDAGDLEGGEPSGPLWKRRAEGQNNADYLEDVRALKEDSASSLPQDVGTMEESEALEPPWMREPWKSQAEDLSNTAHMEDLGSLNEDAASSLPHDVGAMKEREPWEPPWMREPWKSQAEDQSNAAHMEDMESLNEDAASSLPQDAGTMEEGEPLEPPWTQELGKRQGEDPSNEKMNMLQETLSKLHLERYRKTRLTLREILETGPEDGDGFECRTLADVPWHFLNKLLALNVTARNTSLMCETADEQMEEEDSEVDEENSKLSEEEFFQNSINPLDVLCALVHCSDSFLQQEILLKMSMCQFALPLLLPPCDDPKCTFMLWGMRDIVRKWRPQSLRDGKGFREESLVLTPMPTISFVRLGSCGLSKSMFLNEVLSPLQQHHDFFIHRDMESGNVPRRISDGLVEISWYFPGGRENSELFPEPVAVTNLRGDIESHWLQFSLLTEVSSAVFIYIEHISERECALLSALNPRTKYYFIIQPHTDKYHETGDVVNRLAKSLNMSPSQIIRKDRTINDAAFAKKLQTTMLNLIKNSPKHVSIEDMAFTARELGIRIDEDCKKCQTAKALAKEITGDIKDIAAYKEEMMKLQGEPWKKLAKIEKEFCRLKRQGKIHTEDYKSQLKKDLVELRRRQNECDLTDGMIKFISGIGILPKMEKHYFLKWMKFELDSIARSSLTKLRKEYKEKSTDSTRDPSELAELDRRISENSLGVEHYMRELGQFYEAECSMVKEGTVTTDRRQFTKLPGTAADLLLEGFPLELIDGDASNIPLKWVTDVLMALNAKLGTKCRMMVITVLGVQSTGKSTLLNTMFGLQFSVSSGRCTRGAFMLLIKVKPNLKQKLGCDFILVIDTEGLKAPELMTLEGSYEHDNELATLVIGLSDITIINMAMENATEMKDILQIVVHAFLRMEKIGKKPNCQFVHQNVSDISAHDQNMRDRKHLLDQLNKMTEAAARMEKQNPEITFSDIMEYDPDEHNWYIPGLWHGVPPMAPVNLGYSEHVHELKKYLFQFIQARLQTKPAVNIPQYIEWVTSLWNAIKHENFIFSFRNSLVAEAYNQLSEKYSEWEWAFRKETHLWVSKQENVIQNQPSTELSDTFQTIKQESFLKLCSGEKAILDSLEKYFESGAENLNLVERYREDFIRSAKGLRKELEDYSEKRINEAIRIQKGKDKLKNLQNNYTKTIEEKVGRLLEQCRKRDTRMVEKDLEKEFANMWRQTLSELQLYPLEKQKIYEDMFLVMQKDLFYRGSAVNQRVQNAHNLLDHGKGEFILKKEHFDLPWYKYKGWKELFTHDCWHKTEDLINSLEHECIKFVSDKVCSKADYDENYCIELLTMINGSLQDEATLKLHHSPCFGVDLKFHLLGAAAKDFEKMHEDYITENDPLTRLNALKDEYFSTFKALYLEKDACQKRAKDFCVRCLKPALIDCINKKLGIAIVDDILQSKDSRQYTSRMFFQFTVLEKLLDEKNFKNYVEYINNYITFVNNWIMNHILNYYKDGNKLGDLEKGILSAITKKIYENLGRAKDFTMISSFLENFCDLLKEELVISKDSLKVIIFQNTDPPDRFAADVKLFLSQIECDILSELNKHDIQEKLSKLPFKPQDEIFKKVFGCGEQCPFCKVPCEAGGQAHTEHFASIHRPQGLGRYRNAYTNVLVYSLCSSDVASSCTFQNSDTNWNVHPYKDYRTFYPNWLIQPDPSITASDYWKYDFVMFNEEYAQEYSALPATLPDDWKKLTKRQARQSIQEIFKIQ